MADAETTKDELQHQLEHERQELAEAVEALRRNTRFGGRLRQHLPLLTAGAFAGTFVLGGGVGATMRLLARRSRETHRRVVRVGPFTVVRDR
jgi:hypothetical protein